MKILIVVISFSVSVLGVLGVTVSQDKAVRRSAAAQKVRNAVESRCYTISVDMMQPRSMPPRSLDYGYGVRVAGDSVYSCLPYAGRAYSVPYGGGRALRFDGLIRSYSAQRKRKNRIVVTLSVANDEDTYTYTFNIYDSGNASVVVQPVNREGISFTGNIDTPEIIK